MRRTLVALALAMPAWTASAQVPTSDLARPPASARRKSVITAVGHRSSVRVPSGAQVIDGRGKTLVPGLWDCHMHVNGDFTGVQELSLGVTSVRDPGNDDVRTMDRRRRRVNSCSRTCTRLP